MLGMTAISGNNQTERKWTTLEKIIHLINALIGKAYLSLID